MLKKSFIKSNLFAAACIAAFPLAFSSTAHSASSFPEQPITIVVPFSPGGSTDQIARLFGEKMSEKLGQSIVVVNRPGAGSIIGTQEVVRAKPDGYTLLLAVSTAATHPGLYPDLPYNLKRDLEPVTLLGKIPVLMYTNPQLPAKNIDELIKINKTDKTDITFASPGPASTAGLTGELFNEMAGTSLVHIPYNSGSQAMMDVIGGHINILWGTAAQGLEQYKAKKLDALAVTSEKRHPLFPDVPTFKEQGMDLVAEEWFGLLAPKGTPPEAIEKLSQTVQEIVRDESFHADHKLFEFVGSNAEDFSTYIDEQTERWTALIKRLGLKIK